MGQRVGLRLEEVGLRVALAELLQVECLRAQAQLENAYYNPLAFQELDNSCRGHSDIIGLLVVTDCLHCDQSSLMAGHYVGNG